MSDMSANGAATRGFDRGRAVRWRSAVRLVAWLGVIGPAGLVFSMPAWSQTAASGSPNGGPADAPRVLLIPQQETTLVSPTASQVRSIEGDLGSSFKRGATLVKFDCAEPEARLAIAEADIASARHNLDAKKRLQALNAAGDVEVALAEAAVQKANAEADLSKVQINQCRVFAPFNGRVVRQHVRQYQGVRVGDPLLEIVAAGPLKLRLNAPSRWLAWLKPGVRFSISVDETGKTYPARVSALNARVDAASQSIEIEGIVDGEQPDLLAGMSGSALFNRPK